MFGRKKLIEENLELKSKVESMEYLIEQMKNTIKRYEQKENEMLNGKHFPGATCKGCKYLIEEKDDSKNYFDMLVFNPFRYGMIVNKSKITFLNGLIDKVLTCGRALNDDEKLYWESLEWVKTDMKFIRKHIMN